MSQDRNKHIIDFLKNPYENGWDKDIVIRNYVAKIKEMQYIDAEECDIMWADERLMCLDNFANQLFDLIIDGVCNVIESEPIK